MEPYEWIVYTYEAGASIDQCRAYGPMSEVEAHELAEKLASATVTAMGLVLESTAAAA